MPINSEPFKILLKQTDFFKFNKKKVLKNIVPLFLSKVEFILDGDEVVADSS